MLVAFDHPQPSQAAVCPIVHLVDFKVNHEERERGGGASRCMKKRNSLSFGMEESTTWCVVANCGGWQMAAIRVFSLRARGFNDSGDMLFPRRVMVAQEAIYS